MNGRNDRALAVFCPTRPQVTTAAETGCPRTCTRSRRPTPAPTSPRPASSWPCSTMTLSACPPTPTLRRSCRLRRGRSSRWGRSGGQVAQRGPGTGGAQQAARTRRATGTPGIGRPAAVHPHRTPVATPRAMTRGPRQCRGLTPATPGPGHRLPADGAVCGGPTRPRGTSMWGGGAGGPPCRPLAVLVQA